jgi:L-lactate dehydrogenase complex protein LldF
MSVTITSPQFKGNARAALKDSQLQRALGKVEAGFIAKRRDVAARLPEFEALRDAARDIKDHTLAHLDLYLEAYERRVLESGGQVHWAADANDARRIVTEICKRLGAKTVTKGKSMIAEEIDLNAHLSEAGIEPIETDLGEYIIQLRDEAPSHIIAPAIHLNRDQIESDFRRVHTSLPASRNLEEPAALMAEARAVLREKFLKADVGITGANFLIAETGTSVIVTNEGNGDLTQTLPKAHIVLASIEKVVPTLEDVSTLLRVLARSATGQEISVYTTFSTGPRRADDPDGPAEYHVVLLDNGRSSMLGGKFREMLRCIRCGACMNHCPVYSAVGGHAYGWVYPGPMGAVLTPSLIGIDKAGHLPNASTFCGRCEEVCPVRIPLPKLMRHWREREFERHLSPATVRFGLNVWALFARRPRIYRWATQIAMRMLAFFGGNRGRMHWLPLAGGWTRHRDFPVPDRQTFQVQWARSKKAEVKARADAEAEAKRLAAEKRETAS